MVEQPDLLSPGSAAEMSPCGAKPSVYGEFFLIGDTFAHGLLQKKIKRSAQAAMRHRLMNFEHGDNVSGNMQNGLWVFETYQ